MGSESSAKSKSSSLIRATGDATFGEPLELLPLLFVSAPIKLAKTWKTTTPAGFPVTASWASLPKMWQECPRHIFRQDINKN